MTGIDPKTVAERTSYRETSRHSDVLAFIRELQSTAREIIRVESMGTSGLGQEMPVLHLTRTAAGADVPVVLVLANIHAGEVEGKETALMLARDLTLGPHGRILQHMKLLIVPNYNPDGNDAISPENRKLDLKNLSGQIGPEGGVGTRYTGQGINLNRDYMKMEAVESRNLSRLFAAYRPHLTLDLHTTDGSFHRYPLTFDTAHNPASGPPGPIRYVAGSLLPSVARSLRRSTGIDTFFYGNFRETDDPTSGWETYPPLPRYGSHYRGLLGRMDVLAEAYSYISFRERSVAMYSFVLEVLRFVTENAKDILLVNTRAQEDLIQRGSNPEPDDRVGIDYGTPEDKPGDLTFHYPAEPLPEEITLHSWDLDSIRERRLENRFPVDYKTRYHAGFVPRKSVARPFAYVIPPDLATVLSKLADHPIQLERLTKSVEPVVDISAVRTLRSASSPDVGTAVRRETVVETDTRRETRKLPEGSIILRTAQPAGSLAVYLMEAESDDGLVRWNYFDTHLAVGKDYPVLRIPGRVDLPTLPL